MRILEMVGHGWGFFDTFAGGGNGKLLAVAEHTMESWFRRSISCARDIPRSNESFQWCIDWDTDARVYII